MKFKITIKPNQVKETYRVILTPEKYLPYTVAYIGTNSYCWNMWINNAIDFSAKNNSLIQNLQIGNFCSIGDNLECIFGKNHNYKNISTGALFHLFESNNLQRNPTEPSFLNKGSIIIQNDVWIGENVTIMPGVTIRNGAVIAKNSHVVSDIPPYAIAGGNPAKIIGYRYNPEQINMLQTISWWDWDTQKLLDNSDYFTEDIDTFCTTFYEEANRNFQKYTSQRKMDYDCYFAFVDFYENYACYSKILESFLDHHLNNNNKKLLLFIQDDCKDGNINSELYKQLTEIVDNLNHDSNIQCSIEVKRGTIHDAKKYFFNCSHYIVSRTYDAVYFTCLADKLGIDIISGVDNVIQFEKRKNF